jgi:hypothetical protein
MQNYSIPKDYDVWDSENVFYLKAPLTRLSRLLAHYEIYREICRLPGAIVECGVYKGASLSRFAGFRALLENEPSRKIYGLDAFGEFPLDGLRSEADRDFVQRFEAQGGHGIGKDALEAHLAAKGHVNIELIGGDVFQTVPDLLAREPQVRIALLNLDLDVYEPTKLCLEQFLPRMVPGGIIVFDDYNAVEGATRVADELCAEHGMALEKLPFYNVPAFTRVNQSRLNSESSPRLKRNLL